MSFKRCVFLFSLIILVLCVQQSHSIRCYDCNSLDDARCAEQVPPKELEIDCETKNNNGTKYNFCRKIKQVIEVSVNDMPKNTRIIRQCAYEIDPEYLNKCFRRSGLGVRQIHCECNVMDLCNSANRYTFSFSFLIVAIIAYLI